MYRRPRARRGPGLYLVLDVGKVVRILRSVEIRNAPRQGLRPPFLDREAPDGLVGTVDELVLTLLGLRDELDSFGWPFEAQAFFDRPVRGAPGAMRGGRRDSGQSLRILRVPVPRETAFLFFHRADTTGVRGQAPQPPRRRALGLYCLQGPPFPPVPPLPVPGVLVSPVALPGPLDLPPAY